MFCRAGRSGKWRWKVDTAIRQTKPLAKNLKGHLLLAHGMMDDILPLYNTLLVVGPPATL